MFKMNDMDQKNTIERCSSIIFSCWFPWISSNEGFRGFLKSWFSKFSNITGMGVWGGRGVEGQTKKTLNSHNNNMLISYSN